jgi:hypothetical protein
MAAEDSIWSEPRAGSSMHRPSRSAIRNPTLHRQQQNAVIGLWRTRVIKNDGIYHKYRSRLPKL